MALTLAVTALGMTLFTLTSAQSLLWWQVVTLAVTGFGFGGVMSVGSTSIMISAPEEKAGMAGALEGISYELGGHSVLRSWEALSRRFIPAISLRLQQPDFLSMPGTVSPDTNRGRRTPPCAGATGN